MVCDTCIEISQRPSRSRPGKLGPWKVECPDCGAWWRLTTVRSVRFYLATRRTGERTWTRDTYCFGNWAYVPIECQQRRCRNHAKHKVRGKGRSWQYKCSHHAGVCIIA